MKQRKRRYAEGDYGHKRWPRERPVWQVAMAIEPTADEKLGQRIGDKDCPLRFVFHGAKPLMIDVVFTRLRGKLFGGYQMTEEMQTRMLNGKCYRSWVVEVSEPDLHRLSVPEWPAIIKQMMESIFRCQITYFENYETFLNA